MSDEKITLLSNQAKDKVYKDLFVEYHKVRMYNEPETNPSEINSAIAYIKAWEESKTPWGYLITVNPKPGSNLTQFVRSVDKAITKKWIKEYVYAYEQRGEDPNDIGTGFHVHIYVRSNDKIFSEVRREFLSTFKDLIGNPLHINIRSIVKDHEERTINYIIGKKSDEDKQQKQKMDLEWRALFNFENYYSQGLGILAENSENN